MLGGGCGVQVVMFMYLLQSVMHCSPAPTTGPVTFLIMVNCLVTALLWSFYSTECLALALQNTVSEIF